MGALLLGVTNISYLQEVAKAVPFKRMQGQILVNGDGSHEANYPATHLNSWPQIYFSLPLSHRRKSLKTQSYLITEYVERRLTRNSQNLSGLTTS